MGLFIFIGSIVLFTALAVRKFRSDKAGWAPVLASGLAVANFYFVWQGSVTSHCEIDWDGRSNPVVCER